MNAIKTTRFTNAAKKARAPAAVPSAVGSASLRRKQKQASVQCGRGDIEMTDAKRTVIWVTGLTFGVVAADAIAQGATVAGATPKKSPRSRRALLTRLVVLAQLNYDPQKLPPDKTGEAAVGHYFRKTRGVTRISVYDQCYRIAENHETKDMFPSLPPATRNLIIANVAVYLGEVLIGDALTVDFALWPIGTLSLHGKIPGFQAWQIITYSFLHANTTHLFILETVRRTSSASLEHIACRDCRSLVS